MTKWICLDSEGTGLFRYDRPADAEGQPRMAALSMVFLDEELNIEGEFHCLIKPDGWVIPPEATAINGLTQFELERDVLPIGEALDHYVAAVESGHIIAAHNSRHDLKQIRAELRRAGRPDLFEHTPNFCTMRKSAGIIPKAGGKKGWPKLAEACAHIGYEQNAAHTATDDARACAAILRYLRDQGVDLTPEIHYAKEPKDGIESGPPITAAPRELKYAPDIPLAQRDIPE